MNTEDEIKKKFNFIKAKHIILMSISMLFFLSRYIFDYKELYDYSFTEQQILVLNYLSIAITFFPVPLSLFIFNKIVASKFADIQLQRRFNIYNYFNNVQIIFLFLSSVLNIFLMIYLLHGRHYFYMFLTDVFFFIYTFPNKKKIDTL